MSESDFSPDIDKAALTEAAKDFNARKIEDEDSLAKEMLEARTKKIVTQTDEFIKADAEAVKKLQEVRNQIAQDEADKSAQSEMTDEQRENKRNEVNKKWDSITADENLKNVPGTPAYNERNSVEPATVIGTKAYTESMPPVDPAKIPGTPDYIEGQKENVNAVRKLIKTLTGK